MYEESSKLDKMCMEEQLRTEEYLHDLGNDKQKEQIRESLKLQLARVQREGVRLYVDDTPASPDEVAQRCVQEQIVYMPDYVLDDNGTLKQVRYDRVRDQ